VRFHVELIGEVRDDPTTGKPYFHRGISAYPRIGSLVHRIRAADLAAVYRNERADVVQVGVLSQNEDLAATISITEMLSKHFAIVGSTGVGKSSAVSLLVRKALSVTPVLRVMILDPHNEFAHAFPDIAITLDTDTLKLPYWLFKLEELTEVLFRGRERVIAEIDLLRELIPLARAQYRVSDSRLTVRKTVDVGNITADTPIPYRIADLLRLIQDRAGQLDNKDERPALRMLKSRLEAVLTDPRYAFMFGMKRVEDSMQSVVSQIYRVPADGRPVACVQLSGLPSEVTNSVASVLSRLAFDIAMLSRGAYQILVLAEEAHRYLPTNPKLGFEPTRLALARIAKEGRKYGCFLGCITQRPGELDPTILSQCSTMFAMRLANEEDQKIIGTAIGDTSASNLEFLPTLAQREAIAFGEAVSTPMRLMFERLAPHMLPAAAHDADAVAGAATGEVELTRIIHRMRNTWLDDADLETIEDFEAELGMADSGFRRRATDLAAQDNGSDLRNGRRTSDPLFRPFAEDR
jgi:DNA helicase HerA-like ATPase